MQYHYARGVRRPPVGHTRRWGRTALRSVATLALVACGAADIDGFETTATARPAAPHMEPAPVPASLELSVRPTLLVGYPNSFRVTEASAGETVHFFRGGAEGSGPCYPAAGDLCIDLDDAVYIGSVSADDSGTAIFEMEVPVDAVPDGTEVFVQAMVVRGIGGVDSSKTSTESTIAREYEITQISAGDIHACAVSASNEMHCWGDDLWGEAVAQDGTDWQAVAAGAMHSCGLTLAGEISCWGYPYGGVTDAPGRPGFTVIDAESDGTCAIDEDGAIECWGWIQGTPPSEGTYIDVAVGSTHGCALDEAGEAVCWGQNDQGQKNAPAGPWERVDAGFSTTCAMDAAGELTCWGSDMDALVSEVPAGTFVDFDVGTFHACAVDASDAITCWGYNYDGQASPPAESFDHVAGGYYHSCGRRSDGVVECWGLTGPVLL